MIICHQIGDRSFGSNFNTREEIIACKDPISFDGVYKSVMDNIDVLFGKDITFFVMGKYVGLDNSFDVGQPLSQYCTWSEVFAMAHILKAKVGYHSWAHKDLTKLSDDEAFFEIEPPLNSYEVEMTDFAYPYGTFDERIINLVKQAGYKDAWSVHQGDGSLYQRKRFYLNW